MKYMFEAHAEDENFESVVFIGVTTLDEAHIDARMKCLRAAQDAFPSLHTMAFVQDEHASVQWYDYEGLTEGDKKKLADLCGNPNINDCNTYEGIVPDDFALEAESITIADIYHCTLHVSAGTLDWYVSADVKLSPHRSEVLHLSNSGGILWPVDPRLKPHGVQLDIMPKNKIIIEGLEIQDLSPAQAYRVTCTCCKCETTFSVSTKQPNITLHCPQCEFKLDGITDKPHEEPKDTP